MLGKKNMNKSLKINNIFIFGEEESRGIVQIFTHKCARVHTHTYTPTRIHAHTYALSCPHT